MEAIAPTLRHGAPVLSLTISVDGGEGKIAAGLAQVQKAHQSVAIGSYPFYREDRFGVQLVVRGRDPEASKPPRGAVESMLAGEGVGFSRIAA